MKKITTVFFLLFLSFNSPAHTFNNFVEVDSSAMPSDMVVDHLRSRFQGYHTGLKVDVYFRSFADWEKEKVLKAVEILEKVMNSQEFKNRVLNFTWKGKTQFNDNKGMSNQEIFDHLMTGAEDLMPEADQVMNFDLTLYRSMNPWSKVKGYTNPDSMRIYLNKKFFNRTSWTSVDVAGNMAHEWVHKMGFGHDYNYNDDRQYSVPYAIGYMVSEIAEEMGY